MAQRESTTEETGTSRVARRKDVLGAYGERAAERHLCARGMQVLARNWRCDQGELDLVLRDGSVLVVCEVKTRSSEAYGTPHEAVTASKAARIRRLAARWMLETGVRPADVRFDLVAVLRPPRGRTRIEHVPGAY